MKILKMTYVEIYNDNEVKGFTFRDTDDQIFEENFREEFPKEIEKKWQKYWKENKLFEAKKNGHSLVDALKVSFNYVLAGF